MKKLKYIIVAVLVFILGAAAVSCRKKTEQKPTPPEINQNQPQEEPEAPEVKIKESDALQLISERVDFEKYKVELTNENLEEKEQSYYLFSVSEDTIAFEPSVAVNKESGELFSYYEDGTLEPYDNRYSQNPDSFIKVSWNGVYEKKNDAASTVSLSQSDDSSFEFTASCKENELFGVARIDGDSAKYDDGNGTVIRFEMSGNTLTLSDSKGTFTGEYTLKQ